MKISVFVISDEAIIYWLMYYLHDCNFELSFLENSLIYFANMLIEQNHDKTIL